jgi:hypothetical protein
LRSAPAARVHGALTREDNPPPKTHENGRLENQFRHVGSSRGSGILASVVPAPSARVLVTLLPTCDDLDAEAALARVNEIGGELRAEVAAEVTRRRAPELVFRIGHRDELVT